VPVFFILYIRLTTQLIYKSVVELQLKKFNLFFDNLSEGRICLITIVFPLDIREMSRELQERAEKITEELKEALIPLRNEIRKLKNISPEGYKVIK
jgi:hypothetical protein